MAFESELGVQPPLGFFDPLGLLTDADQEKFDRLRYVELKHGRISQLAFLGQIVTRYGITLPETLTTLEPASTPSPTVGPPSTPSPKLEPASTPSPTVGPPS